MPDGNWTHEWADRHTVGRLDCPGCEGHAARCELEDCPGGVDHRQPTPQGPHHLNTPLYEYLCDTCGGLGADDA